MNILSSQIQRHREGPRPMAIQDLGGKGRIIKGILPVLLGDDIANSILVDIHYCKVFEQRLHQRDVVTF